jgi:predicted DNA-binding transcriptional regulator AlpA
MDAEDMKISILINGEEFLDVDNVLELTALNYTKLYELLRYSIFPKPIRMKNRNLWKKSDIEAYLESKKVNVSEPKPEKNEAVDE